jgi:hypothetical protein
MRERKLWEFPADRMPKEKSAAGRPGATDHGSLFSLSPVIIPCKECQGY